jgi:hypothetical protein
MTPSNQPPTAQGTRNAALSRPSSHPGRLRQRCLRCGTDESAGAFCTWCQMVACDLIEHTHADPAGGRGGDTACPLGPYLNPSVQANRDRTHQSQLARDRAAWDATHNAADAEPYIVRRWHHPANPSIAGDAAYLERHPDAATIAARKQAAA